MPLFRKCPICGAALDPGERCDCQDQEPQEATQAVASADKKKEDAA